MTKDIEKLELAILSDVFATVTSQTLNFLLGSFSKHDFDRSENVNLKISPRVSAIIFQLFKVIMFQKAVLTILELNWNERQGHNKTKLSICYHMLLSSTQLQNRSFHVVERTRTFSKCQQMKTCTCKAWKACKACKILFFIAKDANLRDFCCRRRRGCSSSLL